MPGESPIGTTSEFGTFGGDSGAPWPKSTPEQYMAGNIFLKNPYGGGGGGFSKGIAFGYNAGSELQTDPGDEVRLKDSFSNTAGLAVEWSDGSSQGIAVLDQNDTTWKVQTNGKAIKSVNITFDSSWGAEQTKNARLFYIQAANGLIKIPTINGFTNASIIDVDVENSQIIVDGGTWNTNSDATTEGSYAKDIVYGAYSGIIQRGPTAAFDGDLTTRPVSANSSGSGQIFFRPDPVIAYNKLEVYVPDGLQNLSATFNSTTISLPGSEGWITLDDSPGVLNELYTSRGGTNGGVFFSAIRVNDKILIDPIAAPSTISKNISGTGEVSSTDPQNNTMTLANNNGEWVTGYYAQTPEKPAISQIGYLEFGSNGNVTGVTLVPQPAVIMANPNPVLSFPATFGTGETPDTELPYPTTLQTVITAKNVFFDGTVNTSTASSNKLFPATTGTFSGPASGTSSYTGSGVAQLTANLTTFSGREAAANTDPTDVQGALAAKQTQIDDYIAGL